VVWAVSLSTRDLCTRSLTSTCRIWRFNGLSEGFNPPLLPQSPLPRQGLTTAWSSTNIDFAENQLSPCSISFSLLTAAHPMLLQQQRVRPKEPTAPARNWTKKTGRSGLRLTADPHSHHPNAGPENGTGEVRDKHQNYLPSLQPPPIPRKGTPGSLPPTR